MTDNRRPCTVNGDKAYFHRWVEERDVFIRVNSLTAARNNYKSMAERLRREKSAPHDCDVFPTCKTWALVEYLDGEIAKVDPESVRFTDI